MIEIDLAFKIVHLNLLRLFETCHLFRRFSVHVEYSYTREMIFISYRYLYRKSAYIKMECLIIAKIMDRSVSMLRYVIKR